MATDDGHADAFETCAHCGAQFDPGVRYPATTRRGADGSLAVYSFCDSACQAAWNETG